MGAGLQALLIGLIVLQGLKRVEYLLPQVHRATLTVMSRSNATTEDDVRADIHRHGFHLTSTGAHYDRDTQTWVLRCEVSWQSKPSDPPLPALVKELAQRPGVSRLDWNIIGGPTSGPD